MFVKENKGGAETLSVNVKDHPSYQVQPPAGYVEPQSRQKLFSEGGIGTQGHMAHQMYVAGGFEGAMPFSYNEMDSSFAMRSPVQ